MGFWKRESELERELRARRPEPPPHLVDEIARSVADRPRRRTGRPLRIALAGALTIAMLAVLGSFGGLGYAANGVSHAVDAAVRVVVPTKVAVPTISESSAMAQYKVAVCFHRHTLNIDSHAVHALLANGATLGACGGGSFKPSQKLVVACFKGHNVDVAQTSAKTKGQKAALKKLGITLGYCKV